MAAERAGELVLVAGRDPLRQPGGTESYVTAHARTAALAGWTPQLFSAGPRRRSQPYAGGTLHVVRTPMRPVRSLTAPLHRPWLLRAILRHLEGLPGPHVLHGFGAWGTVAVAAREQLAARGVPAVALVTSWTPIAHESASKLDSEVVQRSRRLRVAGRAELAWSRRVTRPSEDRTYHAADAVLVNYASVERLMTADYGPGLAFRRLTYAAPTAFEPEPPAARPAPPGLPPGDAPLLVTVSRHDGRKGLGRFLAALALLRDAGVPFRACLTSGGTLLAAHRQLVAELGLGDRVTLPGRVPDVMPYLRAADVFVLPSTQEGSGSVSVLEALQAGVPVVASDVDGLPEDLTDGHDALLVPPGDAAALAAALRRLLEDAPLRRAMGAAARATYEQRFSPGVAAREVARVYDEVLGARGLTAP